MWLYQVVKKQMENKKFRACAKQKNRKRKFAKQKRQGLKRKIFYYSKDCFL